MARKHKISTRRLSQVITARECERAQDRVLDVYKAMTVEQRLEIKTMLNEK
jgi:hypothetical protein